MLPNTQEATDPLSLNVPYLLVSQNNAQRSLKIKEVSGQAASMLGYPIIELLGMELTALLAGEAADAITDYLEFNHDANDLLDILERVRQFMLRGKNGEEILLTLKIIRDPSRDQHSWFRLIIKDERRYIQESSLQQMIAANMAGVQGLNEETELPDRQSAIYYLEMAQRYVQSHELRASFVVLRLDRADKNKALYGHDGMMKLLRHVASCCRASLRSDDIICHLSDQTLGLLLMDMPEASARIVLNRLRWNISARRIEFGGKPDFSVTISMVFTGLIEDDSRDLLELCDKKLALVGENERNQMVQIPLE